MLTLYADDFSALYGPVSGSPKNDSLGAWKQDIHHAMHKIKLLVSFCLLFGLVLPKVIKTGLKRIFVSRKVFL